MKLYVSTVFGSTSKELEPAERWVWVGFLVLAGDSQWDGLIKATATLGYSDEQLADLLDVTVQILRSARLKMVKADKITVDAKGIISINNWEKYQSEYDRQRKYRNKSYKIKLHNGVTESSPSILYSDFLTLIDSKNLKWEGIEAEDYAAWGQAYPACDIQRELLAMIEWIKANPKKGMKKDYHQFIVGWLARSQKSGGGMRSAGPDERRRSEIERDRHTGKAPNLDADKQKKIDEVAERIYHKEFGPKLDAAKGGDEYQKYKAVADEAFRLATGKIMRGEN